MKGRIYLLLALLGLCGPLSLTLIQESPGYMDAEYYYSGGLRISQGYGFTEEILWNFLDDPAGIPHPSHGYWMPLPSILAVPGLLLFREHGFAAARIPFILLAALLPPLTAALAYKLNQRKSLAIFSGALALLPVFYMPYLATTESFIPSMLIGGFFFLLLPSTRHERLFEISISKMAILFLGVLSGLMHLTRPDGFVWLIAAIAASAVISGSRDSTRRIWKTFQSVMICMLGYLIIMVPWFARNLVVFDSLLSPGGGRSLWVLEYNEIFIYPASILTFQRWLESGWQNLINARVWAAGQNLQTIIAVQGEIILLPLILAGAFRYRQDYRIRLVGLTWLLGFSIMTILFPYQGARGGFFHSGAGLQPIFWALAPIGLESILQWGRDHRDWEIRQARTIFGAGLLILVFALTVFVTINRLYSFSESRIVWNDNLNDYLLLDEELNSLGAEPEDVIMINNAPGYQAATNRPSISIPYAKLIDVCEAANRYKVKYLILEIDQIPDASDLFNHPSARDCWNYLKTSDGAHIFIKTQ